MTEPRTHVLAVVAAEANTANPLESLDAIFAAAVFDIAVTVLFLGDAISTHLLNNAQSDDGKSIRKQWQASELYDINALWVLANDLHERNIGRDDLPSNVQVLDALPLHCAFKHVLSL